MNSQYQEIKPLKEYVTVLENKDNQARGEQIITALTELGLEPTFQKCRWPRIRNIIVDFTPEPYAKRILFTAHYDVVKGSPGANDNASGVAALIGLCHELKHQKVPVKIVFFDREEAWLRTPLIRLGLLGSLFYVLKNDMQIVSAVYNLEFCGLGDCLGIWPIHSEQEELPALRRVKTAALRLGLPYQTANISWILLSSDHMSFRIKGVRNALTLSLLPKDQADVLEFSLSKLSFLKLLTGQRSTLPKPLDIIHSSEDTSDNINESALRLMLSLLLELIPSYDLSGYLSPSGKDGKI
ncbi:MAG TPA: Zn-dependent exopeptidase M28 [Dehalococcoidia bacterium]|nr:Zn-dependent exopeptidase M28 [Dehalococcoidia bacterium]